MLKRCYLCEGVNTRVRLASGGLNTMSKGRLLGELASCCNSGVRVVAGTGWVAFPGDPKGVLF